ncbi:bidirectional sugar transporter SWEET15-like [Phragmites australis]|uniref:bidirectional sugar transporter SWEET15-like n=1 Tax=Phragmites australis TaxID=29695 RepID=UPI002D793A00|nr:bidirectional sugar transporter SWEET15-like [Phragmites australis]
MAFLNMEQQTWAFTFGILGNIISLMVFLSPLPTFYRVYRKKSTEGFQSTPYVVTLFSCMLWMFYAFLKSGAELLITINGVGCVIETAYIAMYLAYAPKASRVLTAKMLLGLNVGLFGLISLVTLLLSSKGTLRVHVLGWICVSVALAVFAAPLSVMRLVIRTKSVEFMPFSLSFCLVLSAVIWFAYGALKKDVFVAVPNVLGFVFGVAQMALYMTYRNKKPSAVVMMVEEVKLPEHVKEVAGSAPAAPEGRASCGAEVHPIDVLASPAAVEVHDLQAVVIDAEPIMCAAAAAETDADGGVDGVPRAPEQLVKPDTAITVGV